MDPLRPHRKTSLDSFNPGPLGFSRILGHLMGALLRTFLGFDKILFSFHQVFPTLRKKKFLASVFRNLIPKKKKKQNKTKQGLVHMKDRKTQKTILRRHLSSGQSVSRMCWPCAFLSAPHWARHRRRSWRLGPWGQRVNSLHSTETHWVLSISKALCFEKRSSIRQGPYFLKYTQTTLGNGKMW